MNSGTTLPKGNPSSRNTYLTLNQLMLSSLLFWITLLPQNKTKAKDWKFPSPWKWGATEKRREDSWEEEMTGISYCGFVWNGFSFTKPRPMTRTQKVWNSVLEFSSLNLDWGVDPPVYCQVFICFESIFIPGSQPWWMIMQIFLCSFWIYLSPFFGLSDTPGKLSWTRWRKKMCLSYVPNQSTCTCFIYAAISLLINIFSQHEDYY